MIAKNQNLKFNNFYLLVLFYLSLIIGFYFGEDLNFGASGDWTGTNHFVIAQLSFDLCLRTRTLRGGRQRSIEFS